MAAGFDPTLPRALYDPTQPRVPAGSPAGGQWTAEGGAAGATEAGLAGRAKLIDVYRGILKQTWRGGPVDKNAPWVGAQQSDTWATRQRAIFDRADELAQATGLHPKTAEQAVGALTDLWAATSAGHNQDAVALQHLTKTMFGRGRVDHLPSTQEMPNYVARGIPEKEMRAYLQLEYDAAQRFFKEHGITHVTLYRGQRGRRYPEAWKTKDDPFTDTVDMQPASSWTLDPAIARSFSQGGEYHGMDTVTRGNTPYVLKMTVPVSRILSTGFTGRGALTEAEVIVLGGPTPVEIWRSKVGALPRGLYDATQPRVPAGQPGGGQWTDMLGFAPIQGPQTVFHGTTLAAVESILQTGLQASRAGTTFTISRKGAVYVTTDQFAATQWAKEATRSSGSPTQKIAVVIKVRVPPDRVGEFTKDRNILTPGVDRGPLEHVGDIPPSWIEPRVTFWRARPDDASQSEELTATYENGRLVIRDYRGIERTLAAAEGLTIYIAIAFEATEALRLNYDASQPRVPAGSPNGGQWTSEGGRPVPPPGNVDRGFDPASDPDQPMMVYTDWKRTFITPQEFQRRLDGDELELSTDPDSGITSPLPLVFHGTSSAALDAIRKNGIIPAGGKGADFWAITAADNPLGPPPKRMLEASKSHVYMHEDRQTAQMFAEFAQKVNPGSTPIILAIDPPGEAAAKLSEDPFSSGYRYKGVIPPSWVRYVGPDGKYYRLNAGQPLAWVVVLVDGADDLRLNYDASQPRVPAGSPEGGQWTAYHGTNTRAIADILKTGIRSEMAGRVWPHYAMKGRTYVTDDLQAARRWAGPVGERPGSEKMRGVIVELAVPAAQRNTFITDTNFKDDGERHEFEHDGDIPPSWIRSVLVHDEKQEWADQWQRYTLDARGKLVAQGMEGLRTAASPTWYAVVFFDGTGPMINIDEDLDDADWPKRRPSGPIVQVVDGVVLFRGQKYDPAQPRHPAGNPQGGQWSMGGMVGMLADIAKPDGGFTYSPVKGSPKTGFALSVHKGRERVLPVQDVTLAALARYARDNRDLLSKDGNYMGGWNNPADGKVYLDVSTVVQDQAEAARLARQYDQIAYFDLGKGVSIPTPRLEQ